MKRYLFWLISTLAIFCWGAADNAFGETPETIDLFAPGDFGSRYYRIPGIAAIGDSIVIAVADRRVESLSDLPGRIDVVSRCSTDRGNTWEPPVIVAATDSCGGYGDPSIVVDARNGEVIVISNHGNGLWQPSPPHIMVSRSLDNAKTWLPPVDISDQIFNPESIVCASAFATSGRAIQLADGRIIFALVVRYADREEFDVFAVYSDDGGRRWSISDNAACNDGDESQIAELPDGRLLMSIRNRRGGPRKASLSTDRGRTWRPLPDWTSLPDPACNGAFLTAEIPGSDSSPNIHLLQILPAGPGRNNLTLYGAEIPADGNLDSLSWKPLRRLSEGAGAYTSAVILPGPSPTILILAEQAPDPTSPLSPDGHTLRLLRLPE